MTLVTDIRGRTINENDLVVYAVSGTGSNVKMKFGVVEKIVWKVRDVYNYQTQTYTTEPYPKIRIRPALGDGSIIMQKRWDSVAGVSYDTDVPERTVMLEMLDRVVVIKN